jgi:gelsolin
MSTFGLERIPLRMKLELQHIRQRSSTIVRLCMLFRRPNAVPQEDISDLKGRAVQHREVQGFESHLFLSYFPNFISLRGGVATGFHHVTSKPPPKEHRLYRVTGTTTSKNLVVREVKSLEAGDAYVLDKGSEVWQFNTAGSSGKEKFKASEFARSLLVARSLQTHVKVFG